jgi:Tfp pilus assembly protein PilO
MIMQPDPADWPLWQRLLVPGALALLLGLIVWQTGSARLERDRDRLLGEEQHLLGRLTRGSEATSQRLALERALLETEAAIDAWVGTLPHAERSTDVLASLAATAREAGLSVLLFQPGEHSAQRWYQTREVSVQLSGSYPDLLRFTLAITAGGQPLSLMITAIRRGEPTPTLITDARVLVRWQPSGWQASDRGAATRPPRAGEVAAGHIVTRGLPHGLRDPFQWPAAAPPEPLAGPRPDPGRTPEPLEAWPLSSLRLVGTLTDSERRWALIHAPDGLVRAAQLGDHLGRQHGRVARIDADRIEVRELLLIDEQQWTERVVVLQAAARP